MKITRNGITILTGKDIGVYRKYPFESSDVIGVFVDGYYVKHIHGGENARKILEQFLSGIKSKEESDEKHEN